MEPENIATRRRSCLAVPGGEIRKLARAADAGADEVVIDLEDAVPAADKDRARDLVARTLATWTGGAVTVRINPPRSPWCHRDLEMCVAAGAVLSTVVVPKVEDAGDLAFLDRLLDGMEAAADRREPLGVQALIESAAGLERVSHIAGSSRRLRALILGYADLAASLGRRAQAWGYARDVLLVAARTHGLAAIDGPFLGVADDDDFRAVVAESRELGFDGKWVIHPRQIATVNAAFAPTADEIEEAGRILHALEQAELAGKGAVSLDGRMVDEAVAVAARRVLAQAGAAS
ncbi:citrate lyase subunit beta / citryl-CoA lyase [Sinosporangium album]|uniref:Citrate lyase subunit beta / citryl-CoA lyase n=1 Tax=Sinosporangium album TaxID=504805 RepID=A0A1G8FQF3_9ACTN|nr:CoA ester lyase [Sinosporangium album]SDH84329.1 citrate lyase subunit beta / citryl-CoA lyase [Sinosporangium album]